MASKPLDRASAHADLAEALLQAGQKDEARKQVMEALMVAPTFTRAQDLLLKLSGGIAVMRRWIWPRPSLAAAVASAVRGRRLRYRWRQMPVVDGNKFAGLKWTFVRIKYGTFENEGGAGVAVGLLG